MKWFPKIGVRHAPMIVWLILGPLAFYGLIYAVVEARYRWAMLGIVPLFLSWMWCIWFALENKR